MLHLHRFQTVGIKIFSVALLLMASLTDLKAQRREMYLYDHDYKPYYFGLTFSINSARFHTQMHSQFLANDSVLVAEPMNSGGFSLGLSATARISDRFQVRFNPQLSFLERSIYYKLKFPEGGETEMTKTVESTNVSFPFQLKLQSDRIGNFRVYLMGGFKADIDLASNARAKKAEDLVKIKQFDFGPELGIGFNFFFQSFILSPEIKISNGLPNIHSRDASLKYSSVFDKIQSRMITFSIHIEG
ncbi:MAG: outer membrane beta-barrel protein [Chitinophagaceae bacterium]|jgi:hypothetical protein